MDRKYVLISFNKLNVLSDVELVAGITIINLANLYTSQRWFLTSRFLNTSVTVQTYPVSTISLQYSDSVSSCTWNRIPWKSISCHFSFFLVCWQCFFLSSVPQWRTDFQLVTTCSGYQYVYKEECQASTWRNNQMFAFELVHHGS